MSHTVGIDLGTTNSCVAVLTPDGPRVISSRDGSNTIPSTVAFVDGQPRFVGSTAARQVVTNPRGTIWGTKRLLGRKRRDPELTEWIAGLPYMVVPSDNGDAWIRVGTRDLSPQEVSALVLAELKTQAEGYLGGVVEDAVVTVPAYFTENQRQAVQDAGAIAGLQVRSVLNEPTAGALAYGVELQGSQTLAVFDLGGGTFDVTILRTHRGVFQVLATSGDAFLGGDDFDRALVEYLLDLFRERHGQDLGCDALAMQRLAEAARGAKVELSGQSATDIKLPFLGRSDEGALHLEERLGRKTFEELTSHLLDDLQEPCTAALEDAGLLASDIDRVLLVGGMTRMPAVRHRVAEIFGQSPYHNINPDEAVALGAAVQTGILNGEVEDVVLLDVTPHSLGIRTKGDRMSVVIDRNTTIPAVAKKIFSTTQDNQTHVDIEVYQGECEDASDNTPLGQFRLRDLPPRPAGEVRVEVEFRIDADGLVEVIGTDRASGRRATIDARPRAGLSREQVAAVRARRAS